MSVKSPNLENLSEITRRAMTYAAFEALNRSIDKSIAAYGHEISFEQLHMLKDDEYKETGELLIDLIFYTLQSMKFLSADLSKAKAVGKDLQSFHSQAARSANATIKESLMKIKIKIQKIKKVIGVKESIENQQLEFKISLNCGDMTKEEAKNVLGLIVGGEISQDFIDANGEQKTIELIVEGHKGYHARELNQKIEHYMRRWVLHNYGKQNSMLKRMTTDLEKQLERMKPIVVGENK